MKMSRQTVLVAVIFACLSLGGMTSGDSQVLHDRISGPLNSSQTVLLTANVNVKAQARYDQGPAAPSMKLPYMTLLLQRSPQQQSALQELLAEQQDKSSPNFQKWLTPEQFGARFGFTQNDLNKLENWLRAQGFSVIKQARAANWITFSGTAAQAQAAFHAPIHRYLVDGEMHYANSTAPAIPTNLLGIVRGIRGLDDFRPKAPTSNSFQKLPFADYTDSASGQHFIAPGDLATIYDIAPLYTAGVNGTGQTIVVAGQTDIDPTDIQAFQSFWSLPAVTPQVVLFGADPGTTQDITEADLDLEVSDSVARNATIIYANSTNVFDSVVGAVDENLGPVITLSYGICEPQDPFDVAALQSLAQQANAQGITWMDSSGDSGAAGCDVDTSTEATQGLAVNLPASVPEVTGVGGTEFNEGGGNYWSNTNNTNGGSALSYIPEEAWNDAIADGKLDATGGGVSIDYAKPSWQTGPGVPNNSFRNVPDVSLSASADHVGYLICTQGSCANNEFAVVGGTSASTPAFAGMVTLLNQYLVSLGMPEGQGNINPVLYQLVQVNPAAFHDVTTGSNMVPCQAGSPDCTNGMLGYNAGAGYDQVTGLGSVDANVLVTSWTSVVRTATTSTLSASATTIDPGTSVTFTAMTTPNGGAGTPTGNVVFLDENAGVSTSLGTVALDSSGTTMLSSSTLPTGTNTVTATYTGDASFSSSGADVTVTVNTPPDFVFSSNTAGLSVTAGSSASATLTVTPEGGFTESVSFSCSNLPSASTCSFNPSSVTPNGSAATSTMTVQTTAPSMLIGFPKDGPGAWPLAGLLSATMLGMLGIGWAWRRFGWSSGFRWPAMAALVLLAAFGMASCGGGSSSGSGTGGTPIGSYLITVTATPSSGTAHTVLLTLNVQ